MKPEPKEEQIYTCPACGGKSSARDGHYDCSLPAEPKEEKCEDCKWLKDNFPDQKGPKTLCCNKHVYPAVFPEPKSIDWEEEIGLMSNWEKELREYFEFEGVTYKGHRHWRKDIKYDLVRQFIKNILKREIALTRKETLEEVKKIAEGMKTDGKEWIEMIHSAQGAGFTTMISPENFIAGKNQALSDLIKCLEEIQ